MSLGLPPILQRLCSARLQPGIEPGVPESFNVLVRELQSLCLDVELMKRQKPPEKQAAD